MNGMSVVLNYSMYFTARLYSLQYSAPNTEIRLENMREPMVLADMEILDQHT